MLPIATLLHAFKIFINNEIIWVVKIGIYIHQIPRLIKCTIDVCYKNMRLKWKILIEIWYKTG